jgi:ATP-binding cassette subfamily B multidrug efflux pump
MKSILSNLIRTDDLPADNDVTGMPNKPLAFIWYFVCQTKWAFLAFTIIWSLSSALTVMGFYYVQVTVDAFKDTSDTAKIWDVLSPHIPVFVIVYLLLQPTLARVGMAMYAEMRPNFMNMIRRHLSLYTYQHGYTYFQNEFAGRISSKVLETPYALINFVFTFIMGFGYALITCFITLYLFAASGWIFFVVTMVWILAYVILLYFYAPRIMRLSKLSHDETSHVRGRYVDALTNISTVKLFGRQSHEDDRFLSSLKRTSVAGSRAWHMTNQMQIWLEVLSSAFIAAVFYFSIEGWRSGMLSTGEVAMILPLMLRLMDTSWWVSDTIFGLFDNFGQIEEGIEAIFSKPIEPETNTNTLFVTNGAINIKNVDFHYDGQHVFKGLDLSIPAGQKVGLVGRSGAGKTTLMNMLLRLYDFDGGQIDIDGQKINDVTKESVRENIAIIPQHTDMLHRSIAENIRYGNLNSTDNAVIEAAKQAHAHEFIMGLVDNDNNTGYDAKAGERGVKLSGGQRQRIAIARAILKDAPILILDEATSALDSESERAIQNSLKNLMVDKTVIAIAHRLSTIASLDRIIVMEKGQIIEDGTHDALLANDGHYAKLWGMQSGGFLGDS